MMPRFVHRALLCALAWIALAATATAQGPDSTTSPLLSLRPGLPVRLSAPTLGLEGDMTVLRTVRDTLVVVGRFGERTVPRPAIVWLDVRDARTVRGGFVRGAKIGAVIGVLNALLCASTCEESERNKALLFSVPAFGLAAGAIGTLFGGESYRRVIP